MSYCRGSYAPVSSSREFLTTPTQITTMSYKTIDNSSSGFDPETDRPKGTKKGKIKAIYDKLRTRGDDERANELRNMDKVSRQIHFANNEVPDFDPKHDESVTNTTEIKVRDGYNELLEQGREKEAEELRTKRTAKRQSTYLNRLRKVDEKADELEQAGESDKADELRSLDSIKAQMEYIDELERQKKRERRGLA